MGNIGRRRARARNHRFSRSFGWLARGLAAGALLVVAAQALAGAVVTDNVFNLTTQAQANVPVTFGQVFKDGDVPSGATLTATLGGTPITLQVDPKATNPDGSLRHAVLTIIVPQLAAGSGTGVPLVLSTGVASAQTPIGLSQLLATGYDASAAFNVGGVIYTVNAKPLLQAANNAGACAPWNTQCNTWLSGPLASEWVVHAPATSGSGATAPGLTVYFAVRAYNNGAGGVGQVRTDIIVENTNAYAPQVQLQYVATLTSGSASYTGPALTQYAYTRWHRVLWWNDSNPQVYLQQDTQYIQDTRAISKYESLTPDEAFLASLRQSCAPLQNCDQTQTMGNTGAQPAIGPLPLWTSVYIVDPDVRAYRWMLANTDALGAYSIHYRDAATGWPISIQRHPYVTLADWAWASEAAQSGSSHTAQYRADLLPNCVNNAVVTGCTTAWYGNGNPDVWDNAHQPAEGYVAYMVTGSYYYMSEVAFGASNNELVTNETYRGLSQGLIGPSHGQVRGQAWVLREMADAAWLLPDGYPLKAEFNADVNNSLANWNATYTNNPGASPLGLLMTNGANAYDMHGGSNNGMAPWQHDFLTWSAGHAAELGFAGAGEFRNWLARFEIGLLTDWQSNPTQGYCWLAASAYNVQVKDSAGNPLSSFTALYAATFPTLTGLACNSPAMVAAVGALQGEAWQAGEMLGYAYSPTGFPANLQIGAASAADSGLPGAQQAWNVFAARGMQPAPPEYGYNDYPNFAVIPRTVAAGPVAPPTMPPPTAPPGASVQGLTSTSWTIAFNPESALMPRCAAGASGCNTTAQAAGAPRAPAPSTAATHASNVRTTGPLQPTPAQRPAPAGFAGGGMFTGMLRPACSGLGTWCARLLPAWLYAPPGAAAKPAPRASSSGSIR